MTLRKKAIWIVGTVVVVILIAFGTTQYVLGDNDSLLTEQEMRQIVDSKYSGEIVSSELTHANGSAHYKVVVKEETGTYALLADASTGKIEQLNVDEEAPAEEQEEEPITEKEAEQIATEEQAGAVQSSELDEEKQRYTVIVENEGKAYSIEIDSVAGTVGDTKEITNSDDSSPATQLSPDEATEIALSTFNGIVTDIDLDEEDGVLLYEVDIETDSEEAEILVNAFTGEVISIAVEAD
ncbi:PepSY domain-containing protein [Shouchella shacheensis]|uniref:PepSY domain-containing protein n=1 Tax=Shouchella shacheensis TaxID=1649580 RepID=UPI00074054FD|nr:PepSY domain-containing protein [Shouchella shacheensis]